jgi:hypothetical protein
VLLLPQHRPSSALIAGNVAESRERMGSIATGSCILKQNMILCGALLALGLGTITTANAQYYVGQRIYEAAPRIYDPGVPPSEVMAIVRSAGLAPLSRPVRRGGAYVLTAASRGGNQVRVVVDAYEGDILRVSPLYAAGRDEGPRITYERDPRFDGGVPPVPPRSVPGAHLANVPPATGPVELKPQHAPLPRPRPSVAVAAPAPDPAVPAAASVPTPVPTEAVSAAPPAEVAPKPQAPTMVPVAPLD